MRRSEGPLLALAFLGGLIALGALIYLAAAFEGDVRGACLLALGAGVLLAREAVAEVFTSLSRPGWLAWNRFMTVVLGLGLIGAGIWEIVER